MLLFKIFYYQKVKETKIQKFYLSQCSVFTFITNMFEGRKYFSQAF